jgi:hypothetical protein
MSIYAPVPSKLIKPNDFLFSTCPVDVTTRFLQQNMKGGAQPITVHHPPTLGAYCNSLSRRSIFVETTQEPLAMAVYLDTLLGKVKSPE